VLLFDPLPVSGCARVFWPGVADNDAASPMNREISRLNTAIDKVVMSDGLPAELTGPWSGARVVRRSAGNENLTDLERREARRL